MAISETKAISGPWFVLGGTSYLSFMLVIHQRLSLMTLKERPIWLILPGVMGGETSARLDLPGVGGAGTGLGGRFGSLGNGPAGLGGREVSTTELALSIDSILSRPPLGLVDFGS